MAAVIEGALQHIPRKWSNVQALYLRTAESAALPIYQVDPNVLVQARRHHACGEDFRPVSPPTVACHANMEYN